MCFFPQFQEVYINFGNSQMLTQQKHHCTHKAYINLSLTLNNTEKLLSFVYSFNYLTQTHELHRDPEITIKGSLTLSNLLPIQQT